MTGLFQSCGVVEVGYAGQCLPGGVSPDDDHSVDGTGDSAVASNTTSVTLEAPTGVGWTQVLIDLGAHFLPENICEGRNIFGRVELLMRAEFVTAPHSSRCRQVHAVFVVKARFESRLLISRIGPLERMPPLRVAWVLTPMQCR